MAYYLITFSNTHSAMAAKSFLKDKIKCQVMPTLREISNSCGISLRVTDDSCADSLQDLMKESPVGCGMYALYNVDDAVQPLKADRI